MTLPQRLPPIFPRPGACYSGDGFSGFREIQIVDHFDRENVYFFPITSGAKAFFLTYHLPLEVFHRVYSPCVSRQDEKSSSKTDSRWHLRFSTLARRCWEAVLVRVARLF